MTDSNNQLMPGEAPNNQLAPWWAGDTEGQMASQISSMMSPAVSDYVKKVVSGGFLQRYDQPYDLTKSFAQQATDPQRLQTSAQVAMGVGPGIIAGQGARTAWIGGLDDAERMEQAATTTSPTLMQRIMGQKPVSTPQYTRDQIFDQTGWWRGPDGQWKFNVPDQGATLKTGNMAQLNTSHGSYNAILPGQNLKLPDILDHPDLYDAYPHLADINVKPTPRDEVTSYRAAYSPDENSIYLSPLDSQTMTSSLLHEVNHAVQRYEGFAKGGSPEEFLPPNFTNDSMKAFVDMHKVQDEIRAAGFNVPTFEQAHGIGLNVKPSSDPFVQSSPEAQAPQDLVDKYRTAVNKNNELTLQGMAAHENYRMLGGEVESRVVQAQHYMQNWDHPPWRVGTYETPLTGPPQIWSYPDESRQIIMFDPGGKGYRTLTPSDSIPQPPQPPGSGQ